MELGMNTDSAESRADTITAALIYLMSHYARTGCPRLAVCVAHHMECLAANPEAAPVVRDLCARLSKAWAQPATAAFPASHPVH